MKLLLDLDGTLLDARERMHGLFCRLVPGCKMNSGEYWKLKRSRNSHSKILKEIYDYSPAQIQNFQSEWLDQIEELYWLDKDVPFKGVTSQLDNLSKKADIYLLTARQKPEMVKYQIEKMGWEGMFVNLIVTGGLQSKSETISDLFLEPTDWIIGDTGHDIAVGKNRGIKTAAVSDGFLNAEVLEEYSPDLLLRRFTDFKI